MNPYTINPPQTTPQGLKIPQSSEQQLNLEIAWSESDIMRALMTFGGNFDPVVKVKTLKIYQEMMEDDQIKAAVELRKQARLSTPWKIVSAEEGNSQADQLRDFVGHCIFRLKGTLEDDLYQIYSGIEFGFSITEKIFEVLEDGPFKGKIGLRALKTREPFNYDFKVDEYGNLLGLVYTGPRPRGGSFPEIGRMPQTGHAPRNNNQDYGTIGNPFPVDKFIIYSYNAQFGNWYGRSDLLAAFRPWVLKKHIMKFWAIWLERYASPFIVAQYKRDAGLKKPVLETMDAFLKELSAKSGLRCSDAWTVTPIQFTGTTSQVYETAVEAQNRFITHALLVPNLMGYSQSGGGGGFGGSSGGSYALGKVQMDTFIWVLDKMGRDTCETIMGEQIIRQLVRLNFPNVPDELMPEFTFEAIDENSVETRSRIVTMLADGGFLNPEEEWVRDFLTLPKREEDVVLPNPNALNPETGTPIGTETGEEARRQQIEIEKQRADIEKQRAEREAKEPPPVKKEQEIVFRENPERQPDRYEKKLRVGEFRLQLDRGDKALYEAAAKVIAEWRDTIIDTIKRRGLVRNNRPKDLARLSISPAKLKRVFKNWMFKFYLDAKVKALEELRDGGVNVTITRKFTEFAQAPFEQWEPLEPTEAIDFFNRKVNAVIIDKAGARQLLTIATREALPYFDQKAFSISGVLRDDILNDAKQIILNGLKRGDEAGAITDLKSMFNKYLDQGMAVDEELLKPYRLQTIVRTNTTEAINQGRADIYQNPIIGDYVKFWQYTSIVDDRTTDYCLCMNGKKFHMEDMAALQPPAHFNCRSFTVPITELEVKQSENGIEVDSPCLDRMMGFSDMRRETVTVPPQPAAPDTSHLQISIVTPKEAQPEAVDRPAAPRSVEDIAATERLRSELAMLIVRCPYTGCGSDEITFTKRMMNVGEYVCARCVLPFRVSNRGDLYLFDAGTERWERSSTGLMPKFFEEK